MAEQLKNLAQSTLASDPGAGGTTWTVASGEGSKFPASGNFRVTCEDEIVLCTARTGDDLTVTRAQEGTSAVAHSAGTAVAHTLTKAGLDTYLGEKNYQAQDAFLDDIAGLGGDEGFVLGFDGTFVQEVLPVQAITVTVSASNTDLTWAPDFYYPGAQTFLVGTGGGTLRSVGQPAATTAYSGLGTRLVIRNESASSVTLLHATAGGAGKQLKMRDAANLALAQNESAEFVYRSATNDWKEIARSVAHTAQDVDVVDAGGYYANTDVESVLQEIGPQLGVFTLAVAASNSSAKSQARADYLCDGTDDDVQIQAAVNALPAYGGRVLLSEGTFNIGATITLPTGVYVALQGQGPVTTELHLQNSTNADMLLVQEDFTVVRDLSLNGNKANQTTAGIGIKVSSSRRVFLHRLWVTDTFGDGIYMVGTGGDTCHSNKISDVYVLTAGGNGIQFGAYSYDAQVTNVWIGQSGSHGVLVNTSSILIDNLHSWGNTSQGVYVNSGSGGHVQLINCYLETNGDRGLRVGSTSPGVQIANSHVRGNTAQGIYNFSGNNMTVTGCVIKNNGASGIRLDTVAGAAIVGNTFFDDQGGKTQDRPIDDNGGTATDVVYVGNKDLASDHQTGGPSLTGAGLVAHGNASDLGVSYSKMFILA